MREASLKNVTILDLLYALTKRFGDVSALKSENNSMTYNQLREGSVDISARNKKIISRI